MACEVWTLVHSDSGQGLCITDYLTTKISTATTIHTFNYMYMQLTFKDNQLEISITSLHIHKYWVFM